MSMIDQIVAELSQRTGMPPDKARTAVESVVSQLKAHLPPMMANHIDGLLAGTIPSAASIEGTGSIEQRVTGVLGGLFR
jgi:hypothetical protein